MGQINLLLELCFKSCFYCLKIDVECVCVLILDRRKINIKYKIKLKVFLSILIE